MHLNEKKADFIWKAFKKGSKEAFATIYKEHVRDLLNYGYKVTSDRRLIEDSIQDLFFELWKNRSGLSDTDSIRFYLFRALRYKIVRNAKVDSDTSIMEIDKYSQHLTEIPYESYLLGLEV
ncbi:MAG TPA: sigma factor, partial [Chryseosolibacter sp.]